VALFLLLLYRFLGLVAVIGLGIYAAFLYAAILLLNVTLTLPGFAGLILTIGVAADANVVIFERIKEEYRAGKSIRAAIAAGYQKGFHTIIDANVVTCITALVLFAVATAGVKGFALLLLNLGSVSDVSRSPPAVSRSPPRGPSTRLAPPRPRPEGSAPLRRPADVSTSIAKQVRVKSSTTVTIRKRRPSSSTSRTESRDRRWLTRVGATSRGTPRGTRRRRRTVL
jgi:hypothetical protein